MAAGQDVLKRGIEIAIEIESVFAKSLNTGREIRTEKSQVLVADAPAFGLQIRDNLTHV